METMTGSKSPEAMFRLARGLGDGRLAAVLAGRDATVPQFVAQAVLSERKRIRDANAGQQAQMQMAQQPPTKRQELLAQMQNEQGVAGVAPADVAQMASGGIVAFSGEDGRSEVRADRNIYDRYNWDDLPTVTRQPAASMSEFFGNLFSRDNLRVDPVTKKPISLGDFMRNKERAGVENARIALGQDFTTGLPLSEKTATPAATAVPPSAVRPAGASRGVGGGGIASTPAAAAAATPASAAPFNADKYFRPVGILPQLGPVTATNPYEKPKSAEEYITNHKALLKQFGVEENPYAEREAALKAKQADAKAAQDKTDAWMMLQTGAEIAGAPGRASQAIGSGISRGVSRKLASDKEFEALKDKRDEALAAIKLAQNEIKANNVKTGIEQLNAATKNYNEADFKLADMTARRQSEQASLAMEGFKAETARDTAVGQISAQVDIEMRKMAQALQISRDEIAARIKAAQISAASSGGRVPSEIQVMEWAQRSPGNMQTFLTMQAGKRAEDPLKALIANAVGGNAPPGAVREKGK